MFVFTGRQALAEVSVWAETKVLEPAPVVTRRVNTDSEDQVAARLSYSECREQAFKRIHDGLVVVIVQALCDSIEVKRRNMSS